jgi:hypothetical protein
MPYDVDIDYTLYDAHCRACDSLLRDLPTHRCPRCGLAFDPFDPETMRVPGYRRPSILPQPPTFGHRMIGYALIVTTFSVSLTRITPMGLFPGMVGWLCLFIAWKRHARRLFRGSPTLPEGPRWRPLVKLTFAAMVIFSFRYHSCPHAYTLWFGPFGISYSDYGGPCHNGLHHGGKRISGNWYIANAPDVWR